MSQSKKYGKQCLLLLAGVALTGVEGRAIEPEKWLVYDLDPVVIRPRLSLSETYNDNIYYDDDKEDDFITTVSPGLNFLLGREDASFINLDYSYGHLFYLDNSDQSADIHSAVLKTKYAGNKLTLDGTDEVRYLTTIVEGGTDEGFLTRSSKVNRWMIALDHTVDYQFTEKTGAYIQGEYDGLDYEKGTNLYDRDTYRGTFGFSYIYSPKTRFFGEVYLGETSVDKNVSTQRVGPSADFYGAFVGARGDFTRRLSGMVKVGYELTSFSDNATSPDIPVAELSLDYRFSAKTKATLTYVHRSYISVQRAAEIYTGDRVAFNIEQMVGTSGRLFANLGASYQVNNFDYRASIAAIPPFIQAIPENPDRLDERYRLTAGLTYEFKLWLKGSLNYEFLKSQSDLSTVTDYDINRVTLGLSIGY